MRNNEIQNLMQMVRPNYVYTYEALYMRLYHLRVYEFIYKALCMRIYISIYSAILYNYIEQIRLYHLHLILYFAVSHAYSFISKDAFKFLLLMDVLYAETFCRYLAMCLVSMESLGKMYYLF